MTQEVETPDDLIEHCRIIVDPAPAAGAWNMAIDEVLLESAIHRGICTVRWYQWECPTLSLGYFQSKTQVACKRLSRLPVVRRLSGGGAIVHHHELTYSCAVPAAHPLARDPRRLYVAVHERIIGALSQLGLSARLRGTARPADSSAFLCFSRGDDFDVVIGNDKVLGSAQRRRKGAILQHGSLVLARSEFASEFPGLTEIAGSEVSATALLDVLPETVARLFGTFSRRLSLTPHELARAGVLASPNDAAPSDEMG